MIVRLLLPGNKMTSENYIQLQFVVRFILLRSMWVGSNAFQSDQPRLDLEIYGTVRHRDARVLEFLRVSESRIFERGLVSHHDPLLFYSPDVVINCAGIIKQQGMANLFCFSLSELWIRQ